MRRWQCWLRSVFLIEKQVVPVCTLAMHAFGCCLLLYK